MTDLNLEFKEQEYTLFEMDEYSNLNLPVTSSEADNFGLYSFEAVKS